MNRRQPMLTATWRVAWLATAGVLLVSAADGAMVEFNLRQMSAGGVGEQLEGTSAPQVALVDDVALSGVGWTDSWRGRHDERDGRAIWPQRNG